MCSCTHCSVRGFGLAFADQELEQRKLNDDYEKRKHLYENLANMSNRSSPLPSRLTSSQPHLNLLKTEENLRSRSAVQATIITDMKIGSMENLNHSTESIPTKNTNRKKRAQERSKNQTTNQQSSDDDVVERNKDTLKSKSQIINSDPLNPERAKRKKKKKKDGWELG
jgi:hypothetical protein